MVNTASLTGTGNLPASRQTCSRLAATGILYLVPTAEVPRTNMHRGEILDGRTPPHPICLYALFSQRSRVHRADVRGLIRQHQFDKVELMSFTTPDQSYDELEQADRKRRGSAQAAGLAVPDNAADKVSGDMGFASAKTYDIEVWLPSQNTYREIIPQYTEAFRAVAPNIRPSGVGKPAHTLNGSGLALGRTLIAILENYQQQDGSVVIPDALRPFMGGRGRDQQELTALRQQRIERDDVVPGSRRQQQEERASRSAGARRCESRQGAGAERQARHHEPADYLGRSACRVRVMI